MKHSRWKRKNRTAMGTDCRRSCLVQKVEKESDTIVPLKSARRTIVSELHILVREASRLQLHEIVQERIRERFRGGQVYWDTYSNHVTHLHRLASIVRGDKWAAGLHGLVDAPAANGWCKIIRHAATPPNSNHTSPILPTRGRKGADVLGIKDEHAPTNDAAEDSRHRISIKGLVRALVRAGGMNNPVRN
ncbi:hypothetical protein BDQ17DRAFT_1329288 [Cyathus striatus]|nr:hypothetical protein BDQ17DRAFT_1329288 [Cyathus striatus]